MSRQDGPWESVLPALLDGLTNALRVLLAVVLVKVGCLDVGWGTSVRIIKQTEVTPH